MIRLYRARYDAFDQPLFLAGESYGTTRAMEVAGDLARRRTPVAGVMLISGFFDVGQTTPRALNQALELSMFTAAAWYHKRLAADLQAMSQDAAVKEAVAWARKTYAPAIENPDAISRRDRATVLAGPPPLAPASIPRPHVEAKTPAVDRQGDLQRTARLLDDHDEELGRYDARMVVARRDLAGQSWLPTHDPSLAPMLDLMEGTSVPLIRYIRNTLGYHSDLLYRGPFGEAFHPSPMVTNPGGLSDDWMTLMWNRAPRPPKAEGPPPPKMAAFAAALPSDGRPVTPARVQCSRHVRRRLRRPRRSGRARRRQPAPTHPQPLLSRRAHGLHRRRRAPAAFPRLRAVRARRRRSPVKP